MIRSLRTLATFTLLFSLTTNSPLTYAQTIPSPTTDLPPNAVWLDSLNIARISQDYGTPNAGKSVDGNPITLGGTVYPHGVGTHANSSCQINAAGGAVSFHAVVGVDDEKKLSSKASVQFIVKVDGVEKYESPVMHGGTPQLTVSVDLTGAKIVDLDVSDAGDGINDDHADWADAYIVKSASSSPDPILLDPNFGLDTPGRLVPEKVSFTPAFHSPTITGSTPGRPFLFMLPVTGQAPLRFSAHNLPTGLTLDKNTGIITGSLTHNAVSHVTVVATNSLGKASEVLTIVGGQHKLALTPPMGWNSWNVFAGNVDQGKVDAAAQVMIDQGLAKHGYEYVNIDDTWESDRDSAGNITTNKKFPDMKALADSVHAKGLRVGIYSSPGPTTCAGYPASYQHEQQDANSYANWGFDYLKYDWCSYSQIAQGDYSLATYQKPYQVMRDALDHASRDIVFSLCQYGMGDVWKWGANSSVGGNCWRTTGDIQDTWRSMYGILEGQNGHEVYAGPGHWNDPDMLVLGSVGWGAEHPTRLFPNEQLVHFSMWSMLSAPLLIGCDMTKLDDLTRNILTNDEVIAIDQDPLGIPAKKIVTTQDSSGEIWARPLADHSTAVALINPTHSISAVSVKWSELGLSGPQKVRDLWLHQNIGVQADGYSVSVPAHGIVLLKLTKA